ncbi:Beta-2 adrenergic receptor [Stylophora pistillata]|uniref:Beta-2 adrenergic receptor n=1 Tax=Stylophora pistillata TaxID=50429 RepID=A0A2B4SA23_STYPI|nr:Beta-2 adrenergic receptor [Stylophora pistillata]
MNNTTKQDPGITESFIPLPSSFVYPVATCYILIVAVAVIGNIMVCSAILINKNLRKMPTNVFIFSLASSDLLTATLSVPFDIEGLFLGWVWNHGEAMCKAWITVYLITVPTSILTLLAVSVDRYKSLSDPLNRYRRLGFMTHKRGIVINLMIWLYSILFALLPIMGWRTSHNFVLDNACLFPFPPVYHVLSSSLNFILPLIIACGIHLKIYRLVCKQLKNFDSSQRAENNDREPSERERKVYLKNIRAFKTTSMFVGAFFLCWVPYSSVSIVAVLCESCTATIPPEARVVLLMIGYLNSALNPFLFAFRSKRFKAVYPNVFGSPRRLARLA